MKLYRPSYLVIHRGSYISAHISLNLLNELRKRDKMRCLLGILSLLCNELNKFNNTGAQMLDSIFHMMINYLKIALFALETVIGYLVHPI